MADPTLHHLKDWRCFLALGLGSGLSPKAPGTAGSVLGLILFLSVAGLPLSWLLIGITVAAVAGIALCGHCAARLGEHDHGAIVWDEFVGVWIALLAAGGDWRWMLAAFVLFRLFDIAKPWPISWLDRKVGGGLGIMLDDILAGIIAAVLLYLGRLWIIA